MKNNKIQELMRNQNEFRRAEADLHFNSIEMRIDRVGRTNSHFYCFHLVARVYLLPEIRIRR